MLLAELKVGDAFGEEALVSGAERNATVTMQTNGMLLRVNRQDFLKLMQEPLLHRLNYGDAIKKVAQGAIWIDARHPSEYRYDKLPDAINVPLNDIRNAIGALNKSHTYLLIARADGAVRLRPSSWRKRDTPCMYWKEGCGRCPSRSSNNTATKLHDPLGVKAPVELTATKLRNLLRAEARAKLTGSSG